VSGFPNPYTEVREQSQGELSQEYAALFNMAALFFGLSFTDREKQAIPVVIGAIMRERKKIDLESLTTLLKQFMPHD
jgi:hypothetical protein